MVPKTLILGSHISKIRLICDLKLSAGLRYWMFKRNKSKVLSKKINSLKYWNINSTLTEEAGTIKKFLTDELTVAKSFYELSKRQKDQSS